MLDILFVHPGASDKIYQELSNRFSAIEPPTWSLLLAEAARSKGFKVNILDCDVERLDDENAKNRILEQNPNLIIFPIYGSNPNAGTTKMTQASSLSKKIKEFSSVKIAWCGSHPSALPQETLLNHKECDFILTGDGVYASQELALKLKNKECTNDIRGLAYLKNGIPVVNEGKIVSQERMDEDLPGYAFDLLPKKEKLLDMYRSCNWHADFIDELRSPYVSIYTSLGCNFKCNFCIEEKTKVITSFGKNKEAKYICEGDKLIGYDEKSGQIIETKVLKTISRDVKELYSITLSNGRSIKITGEHPFYSEGKWVDAKYLNINDNILNINSNNTNPHYVKIIKIEKLYGDFKVYNFECDSNHNFFAEYILTHNCMINSVNREAGDVDRYAADQSKGMRFWSPQKMFELVKYLYGNGIRTIRLADEMFFLNKKYFEPFLTKIVESGMGKELRFWAYARVDTVQPKYLELFKNAGVKWLALGIEAANTSIRKEVTKGNFQDVDIRDVVNDVRNAGISVIANYIFGFPGDTYETMNETLDLAIELNTEMMNCYATMALPGSPLYWVAKNNGWDLPENYEDWSFHSYGCLPLPTNHLSAKEVIKFRDNAWKIYFNNPKYHELIRNKFGEKAEEHIKDMCKIKLNRKLLGD